MQLTMKLLAALGFAFSGQVASGLRARKPAVVAKLSQDTMCMFAGRVTGEDDDVLASTPADESSMDEKKATLKDAIKVYQKEAAEYKAAQTAVMTAMEAMLETPAYDAAKVTDLADGKVGKDTLVVFYAPWCPHCQRFVLHDGKGNPAAAPLEILGREFKAENAGVEVARADVDKIGWDTLPAKFQLEGVPTLFFVKSDGAATKYPGNPHDLAQIKSFVSSEVAK